MMGLDFAIIALYLVAINIVGIVSARVTTINDYFLGNRTIPWPVACFSIVATETSSLTFISIPGLAYVSDLGFLQVALGYILGRILVAVVLIPRYFSGNLETAYQFLHNRFGLSSRRVMAVIFHVTRLLADGIRLFATAIPLTLLLGFGTYWQAILIIGAATFIYTLYGGIKSVAITDSIQFFIYLAGAAAGIWIISDILHIPIRDVFSAIPTEKLRLFSTGTGGGFSKIFKSYNIFSGLIGGALLSFASHGTDHLIVQRVLTCRDVSAARKAMVLSGIIVFFQFLLFMILGLMIHVLAEGRIFSRADEIMPEFIIRHVPPGTKGLMLAGILAAAMSTISSSINSLSSSTAMDILLLTRKNIPEKNKVLISRGISLFWACAITGAAILVQGATRPLVELALNIASITYGGMLGIFILGTLRTRIREKASLTGAITGTAFMAAVYLFCPSLIWPWYVPLGFTISFSTGAAAHAVMRRVSSKAGGGSFG